MLGYFIFEGVDDVARLVERERGLGEIGHAVGVGHLEGRDLSDIRDHLGRLRRFAQRAFDLVVVAVADQHQRVALLGELDGLDVDLGDQRAGGVNHLQIAAFARSRAQPERLRGRSR